MMNFDKIKENKETLMSIGACIGVVGVFASTIWGTIKSIEDLQYDKDLIESTHKDDLKYKAATCWKNYILSFASMLTTMGLIIASDTESKKKIEYLTTSYIALSAFCNEYRENMIEAIGVEQESKVHKMTKDDILPLLSETVYDSEDEPKHGDDEILFIDTLTGNRFYARLPFMKDCRYKLNFRFVSLLKASMYDWYEIIGEDLNEYDLFGDYAPAKNWNVMDAYNYDYSFIDISFPLSTDYETGEVCRLIVYNIDPTLNEV